MRRRLCSVACKSRIPPGEGGRLKDDSCFCGPQPVLLCEIRLIWMRCARRGMAIFAICDSRAHPNLPNSPHATAGFSTEWVRPGETDYTPVSMAIKPLIVWIAKRSSLMSDQSVRDLFDRRERVWHEGQYDLVADLRAANALTAIMGGCFRSTPGICS